MSIALALLARLWPFILSGALALGAYFYADKACWSSACHSQRARADKLEADNKAAHERASALALLWAGTLDRSEKDTHDKLAQQAKDFARLTDLARSLPSLPSIRLSPDAWRVLDDASSLANAAGPSTVNQEPPAAISESALAEKWSEAAAAYADAREKWASCVGFYNSLRNSQ